MFSTEAHKILSFKFDKHFFSLKNEGMDWQR